MSAISDLMVSITSGTHKLVLTESTGMVRRWDEGIGCHRTDPQLVDFEDHGAHLVA